MDRPNEDLRLADLWSFVFVLLCCFSLLYYVVESVMFLKLLFLMYVVEIKFHVFLALPNPTHFGMVQVI